MSLLLTLVKYYLLAGFATALVFAVMLRAGQRVIHPKRTGGKSGIPRGGPKL